MIGDGRPPKIDVDAEAPRPRFSLLELYLASEKPYAGIRHLWPPDELPAARRNCGCWNVARDGHQPDCRLRWPRS